MGLANKVLGLHESKMNEKSDVLKSLRKSIEKKDDAYKELWDMRKMKDEVKDETLTKLFDELEDVAFESKIGDVFKKIERRMKDMEAEAGDIVGPKKAVASIKKMYSALAKKVKAGILPGLKVIVKDHEAPYDLDGYHYPENLTVKLENWSNHFFSYRPKFDDYVMEGQTLNKKKGLKADELIDRMVKELGDWKASRMESYPDKKDMDNFFKSQKMKFEDKI